jgi:hypothetical protein
MAGAVHAEPADVGAADAGGDAAAGDDAEGKSDPPPGAPADPRDVAPPPFGLRFAEPLEGERFRLAYRYEREKRQGLLVGSRSRKPSQVVPPNAFNPYDRTPRQLVVETHRFQLAWAPHPRVTLVAEVPFKEMTLQSLLLTGERIDRSTDGVGDVTLAMMLPFIRRGNERSHVALGLHLPTGGIRRGGDETRLPYDLQPGNGSVDFEWGWTYRGEWKRWSWGGQAQGLHPLNRNGLKYREGSRFEASLWGARTIVRGLSASFRLGWEKQNNIRQNQSDPITDPSANSKARGGTRFAAHPGLAFSLPRRGQGAGRLAVEVEIPFYQDLDGPQLERDWLLTAGWQWDF